MTKADKIKELLAQNLKQTEIAEIVGVKQSYVSQVKCGSSTSRERKNRQAERDREENKYPRKSFMRRKKKARKMGREFSIKWEDLEFPTICPLLGIDLDYSKFAPWANTPSLDRKDNSKGYVPGNVWIISMRANTEKRQKSLDDYLKEIDKVS